jgi:hypothetical protein
MNAMWAGKSMVAHDRFQQVVSDEPVLDPLDRRDKRGRTRIRRLPFVGDRQTLASFRTTAFEHNSAVL